MSQWRTVLLPWWQESCILHMQTWIQWNSLSKWELLAAIRLIIAISYDYLESQTMFSKLCVRRPEMTSVCVMARTVCILQEVCIFFLHSFVPSHPSHPSFSLPSFLLIRLLSLCISPVVFLSLSLIISIFLLLCVSLPFPSLLLPTYSYFLGSGSDLQSLFR